MHAVSSYPGNKPTKNKHTHKHTPTDRTDYNTLLAHNVISITINIQCESSMVYV